MCVVSVIDIVVVLFVIITIIAASVAAQLQLTLSPKSFAISPSLFP